ncbi:MAG: hypothetical protein ACTSWW_00990, partial [Promethearchaeota archaeon]
MLDYSSFIAVTLISTKQSLGMVFTATAARASKMKQVERINRTLKGADLHVSHIQQALHRYGGNAKRAGKLAFELRLLHRRRKNLKHEAEMLIAQEVYAQIKYHTPHIVAYENLRGMSPRGKRGTLAKIVTYMYKRSDALAAR